MLWSDRPWEEYPVDFSAESESASEALTPNPDAASRSLELRSLVKKTTRFVKKLG